jgi:hypothetical protein
MPSDPARRSPSTPIILFEEQGTQGRKQGMGGGTGRVPALAGAPTCAEFVVRRATVGEKVHCINSVVYLRTSR